jgi:hypothetical protein
VTEVKRHYLSRGCSSNSKCHPECSSVVPAELCSLRRIVLIW